jgi:hypothetical protein
LRVKTCRLYVISRVEGGEGVRLKQALRAADAR